MGFVTLVCKNNLDLNQNDDRNEKIMDIKRWAASVYNNNGTPGLKVVIEGLCPFCELGMQAVHAGSLGPDNVKRMGLFANSAVADLSRARKCGNCGILFGLPDNEEEWLKSDFLEDLTTEGAEGAVAKFEPTIREVPGHDSAQGTDHINRHWDVDEKLELEIRVAGRDWPPR
ncbi:hypothetical protein HYX70_00490 [Candidatus Saccharibacteria bacterium]|nr:hypothetical protein [Candidatus Saccharibacteria bacterium]